MTVLALNISDKTYYHGKFVLHNDKIEKNEEKAMQTTRNCFKIKKKVGLDCAFVHYLVRELLISGFYRIHFIRKWTRDSNSVLTVILKPTKHDLIDYNWNERVYDMVRERCELDHALSWLSTLGGAFSALGDYFPTCADTAGKISIHQLKLALRLDDPNIQARCRLYLSLSLIQKKRFRYAKRIVYREFRRAKNANVVDTRLLNMCRGIWAKLQYEHGVYIKKRGNVLSRKMKRVVI